MRVPALEHKGSENYGLQSMSMRAYQNRPTHECKVPNQVFLSWESRIANFHLAEVRIQEIRVKEKAQARACDQKGRCETPYLRRESIYEERVVNEIFVWNHFQRDAEGNDECTSRNVSRREQVSNARVVAMVFLNCHLTLTLAAAAGSSLTQHPL